MSPMQSDWQMRDRQLDLIQPCVMGILNVTPDSFSDGGTFLESHTAVDRALTMESEGATIIDIGGESTRPGSLSVSLEEELSRVIPVIEKLPHQSSVIISIDTRKPAVARAALQAGAYIVNDVEACRDNPQMWECVSELQAGYVAMHMKGDPQTMQENPQYDSIVSEVSSFFQDRLERLKQCGIQTNQVVLDVGIGFGKSVDHNLELLQNLQAFHSLGCFQLLGVSRKSLFKHLLQLEVGERLSPSIACALWGAMNGVKIFRVHDVQETVQALKMWSYLTQPRKQ